MRFFLKWSVSAFFVLVANLGHAADAYAIGDCAPDAPICTFNINVSCPMVRGVYKSNDYAGDFIFWSSRGDSQPVTVDGYFDSPVFDYQESYSTYMCERQASSGRYDFTYLKEVNLLDAVKVYFEQHHPYFVDCHFIQNDPTQGAVCSAEA